MARQALQHGRWTRAAGMEFTEVSASLSTEQQGVLPGTHFGGHHIATKWFPNYRDRARAKRTAGLLVSQT